MSTHIFPAIDLRDGGVVRLYQGDYAQTKRYETSPLDTARAFEAAGASHLHMVDLDGALYGTTPNYEVVREVAQNTGLFVEIGGGIRDMQRVRDYLNAGVSRVIIGTAAVQDPAFLAEALDEYGPERIVVGADLREGRVAVQGWTEDSGLNGLDFCSHLRDIGIETVIATDIACDGALHGTNRALYAEMNKIDGLNVVASGGVTSLDDVAALCALGVSGIIIGKALYEGALDLQSALALAAQTK